MREQGPLLSIDSVNDFWPEYIERYLFTGLNPIEVNSSFSYPLNKFLNEAEFEILLQRVAHHGIGVLCIHARGAKVCCFEQYDWQNCHISNKKWIPLAFKRLKKEGDALLYMADLYIFDEQLQKN